MISVVAPKNHVLSEISDRTSVAPANGLAVGLWSSGSRCVRRLRPNRLWRSRGRLTLVLLNGLVAICAVCSVGWWIAGRHRLSLPLRPALIPVLGPVLTLRSILPLTSIIVAIGITTVSIAAAAATTAAPPPCRSGVGIDQDHRCDCQDCNDL